LQKLKAHDLLLVIAVGCATMLGGISEPEMIPIEITGYAMSVSCDLGNVSLLAFSRVIFFGANAFVSLLWTWQTKQTVAVF
jgi:hypothetical protein